LLAGLGLLGVEMLGVRQIGMRLMLTGVISVGGFFGVLVLLGLLPEEQTLLRSILRRIGASWKAKETGS
jgi:hypothetical protein